MRPNNFAMRDWHLEHIDKVIIRYIKGISPDASSFEKRNFKKYSTISSCAKQIEYDIKHGVTTEQVMQIQIVSKDSMTWNDNSSLQKKWRLGNRYGAADILVSDFCLTC